MCGKTSRLSAFRIKTRVKSTSTSRRLVRRDDNILRLILMFNASGALLTFGKCIRTRLTAGRLQRPRSCRGGEFETVDE